MGYEFAFVESVVVIMLIGLSVDYVVHLGHCFSHSIFKNRQIKTKEALSNLGSAILAG